MNTRFAHTLKYFLLILLVVLAVSARAQITLEHRHLSSMNSDTVALIDLIEVDSGTWQYVFDNFTRDTTEFISIYNLDHSLNRSFAVPRITPDYGGHNVVTIAKDLFDLDGKYEYLWTYNSQKLATDGVRILREDGSTLFSCDSCQLYNSTSPSTFGLPASIKSTDSGVKMMIARYSRASGTSELDIYSLPGKIPNPHSNQSDVTPSFVQPEGGISTSAYPNPSSGIIRIAYQLPIGVSSGELILTDEAGREVKRYRVTSAFSDLEIQAADLPSGAYFYKIVTQQGESAMQKIVRE